MTKLVWPRNINVYDQSDVEPLAVAVSPYGWLMIHYD